MIYLMFTTLLILLYPPLKGFSQDQAHTYTYGLCSFLQHLQGVSSQKAFEGWICKEIEVFLRFSLIKWRLKEFLT